MFLIKKIQKIKLCFIKKKESRSDYRWLLQKVIKRFVESGP